jgi:hypothetical protein
MPHVSRLCWRIGGRLTGMHEGRSGQSSATLTLADVAEARQPPTACRSTPRLELIEELVYGVVCMRRDFLRIRRQIGKLRESQMSLTGPEACRMNAACALGLCVAGLRGQLRKLPFGVCTPRRLGPGPSRGSSWLGGLLWGRVSRSQILFDLSMALLTAAFVSDVVSTLPPAVARRCGDYRRLAGAGRPLNGEEAVRRWGQRPLRPLHLPQV